ncbi:bifunctional alpha,alpha-trehalose-phosphate synthase (UDP-forming)/trehalose-phosphatase [Candidatus Saccharibacteria bacterium]|nr:bifunctional alpha,alpha-trehalose-phosphate synthase (UDP-forming)/trehalose-phosphatase [Candidatus Saccharibacteria bacterium]
MNEKLVIISTRLPVSVSRVDGELQFNASSGGLATGIDSLKKTSDSVWVGWPGIASDDLTQTEKKFIISELHKRGCYPIFLTNDEIDKFYGGYSNSTLWPLFHYFPNEANYQDSYWEMYQAVNAKFAKVAHRFASNKAKMWVHDYQLMLVPQMLRKMDKDAAIGFFLHTPFPSFEIFRLIPQREALLKGLLGANLVGFHTYDYVNYFLSSVSKILGYENMLGTIKIGDRLVQADAFPIGIDYKKFARVAKNRKVNSILKSFDLFNVKTKVILAVDRADYSKGIPARLDAFELFLENYPQHLKKAVLVLIAVPSRGDVDAYKELRTTIEQKVSRINGRFSTTDWAPITYRYQSLPFNELCALYSLADVMLVTPLRDGMNLVAKEFVASKHKSGGVLVLSDMAGAATELPDAILVNPNNTQQVASAINLGLTMPNSEQRQRMKTMQARISEYTIEKWAADFVTELIESVLKQKESPKQLNQKQRKTLLADYDQAKSRLILLDYDATLKNFVNSLHERNALPTEKVKKLLKSLTKDKKNKVIIISGRPRSTLEKYFENKDLGLVAEYGGWVFDAGSWIKSSLTAKKWKKDLKPILKQFVARTAGSELEEKDFSLVWHYRHVSPNLAYVRKEELKRKLRAALATDDIGVFDGRKIVEIKPKRMNKGVIVSDLIAKNDWDFILAIGDDYTDEDMFIALPADAYSINVGKQTTNARFQLNHVDEVLELIKSLP